MGTVKRVVKKRNGAIAAISRHIAAYGAVDVERGFRERCERTAVIVHRKRKGRQNKHIQCCGKMVAAIKPLRRVKMAGPGLHAVP